MRILVVEDDVELGEQVVGHLTAAGFEAVWWREGHSLHADAVPEVSMVLLDLMVPRVSGMEMLRQLRACSDVPVVVLSARYDPADKVEAFRLGADDYVTKPFWPEELVERVRARLRRPTLARGDVLEHGPLAIDTRSRRVTVDGDLTRVEYEFLVALARRPGAAVTRGWLVQYVLDPDRDGNERTLDVHASRLRKKVGRDLVETVWGIGYRLAGRPR